jgi:hypothetical protein
MDYGYFFLNNHCDSGNTVSGSFETVKKAAQIVNRHWKKKQEDNSEMD